MSAEPAVRPCAAASGLLSERVEHTIVAEACRMVFDGPRLLGVDEYLRWNDGIVTRHCPAWASTTGSSSSTRRPISTGRTSDDPEVRTRAYRRALTRGRARPIV
jgi:hypothetical protein